MIHLLTDSRRGLTASNTNVRPDDEAADDDDGDAWCGIYFGLRCSKYPLDGDVPPAISATPAIWFDVGDGVEYVIFGLRGGSSRLKYWPSADLVP